MNKTFTRKIFLASFFLATLLPFCAISQGSDDEYTPEKIEAFKEDVQNMVAFLEYSFNTLGNPKTSARDKDVIINQSYAKIFMDAQVQIEDDLDDNRETLINKDVQAYLKDIDFFFKEAVFALNVSSIDHHFKADREIYFVVTLTRTLNAMTVLGDTVSSNKERFIEINYDDVAQDLRIASIYTTRIDEKDELFAWWNKMPNAWKEVLGSEAFIKDTIPFSSVTEINDTMAIAQYVGLMEIPIDTFLIYDQDTLFIEESDTVEGMISDTIYPRKNYNYRMLQRIANEPEIDISNNLHIRSLEPLAQMGAITKVNCANTMVSDLNPLRNLINIESLICSGTAVTDLNPMKYSVSLKSLDISSTLVHDLEPVANLRNLEYLNISGTEVDSLEMIAYLIKLEDLRLSNTGIQEITALENLSQLRILNLSKSYVSKLDPLKELYQLERIYINNTKVDDLSPLGELHMLQTIYLDSTNVTSLEPLNGLDKLESIYCDHTGITDSKANAFMNANPRVLVVYESIALAQWWNKMEQEWQQLFRTMADLSPQPGKEELHRAVKIEKIDVSGNSNIQSLAALTRLTHLRSLDCSGTNIDKLWPLADLIDIEYLNCSNTKIKDCEGLRDLLNLEYLNMSNTQIDDIQCISRIKNLRELHISNTGISTVNVFGKSSLQKIFADSSELGLAEVVLFKKENPDCIVVYQTQELQAWWTPLNAAWKDIFSRAINLKGAPEPIDLQKMADLKSIDLEQSISLGNLKPLKVLYQLEDLRMNGTQIADLEPISGMTTIKTLDISNNPVENLSMIGGLHKLTQLEFKNTPVSDLEPITGLVQLEILDMAGTQIKKLNELALLQKLRQVSFYNTNVKSLSPLEGLGKLEVIKCYNTKLNSKKVNKFGETHPNCEIIFY